MIKQILAGQLRHAATAAGGALVAHGLTNASGAQQFVGAVMVLGGLAWSALQKYLTSKQPVPAPAPVSALKSPSI